ncbi:Protein of unknown function [Spirosomataceae bacterium TFI 002]|nr:Protein of unknown function [Spirosomataceae bacterium TFI 002]
MKKVFVLALLFFITKISFAKVDSLVQPQVRFSPTMIANLLTEEKSYLKLTYGQPYKKGRRIFGNLVPYGEIWRLGANEATEMTISKDFEVGTKKMKAGTYTLFALPAENKWTIYFNKKLGQWGTFDYQQSDNLFAIEIPVETNKDVYEGFTVEMREVDNRLIHVYFLWDDVRTVLPLKLIDSIETPKIQETAKEKRKRLRKERRGK